MFLPYKTPSLGHVKAAICKQTVVKMYQILW